ncbi:hypothetical protein OC846_003297 [Tilletia horrida]|uniref:Ubiquitin-related modifier 1 n=1 Tax=Tilletia horrida TaxID=155126 RepID=A0AAN6GPB3_9BASI|nr:hypothetical protein OC846_003297 [Tilletia horrida]
MTTTAQVPILRVLLVRHGETNENVAGIIQGQLDTDLNPHGRAQAQCVAQALADEQIDEVYTSSLRRAVDTATAIHQANKSIQQRGIPLLQEPRLMERYFGVLQGKVWKGGDRSGVEGIEPVESVTERLAGFWNDVVLAPGPWEDVVQDGEDTEDDGAAANQETGKGPTLSGKAVADAQPKAGEVIRTILLVGHGSALSTLAGLVLLDGGYVDLGPGEERGRIWNCSITEIHVPASPARSALSSVSSTQTQPQTSKSRFASLGSHYKKSRSRRWLVRPGHLNPLSSILTSNPNASLRTAPSTFTWPDGTPLGDIGYGPGRGVILRWADVTHIKAMASADPASAGLVKNVDEMVENPSAPVSGTATPALRQQATGSQQQTLPVVIEFGGGTELLTSTPEQKSHKVQIPARANDDGRPSDVRYLIKWISENLIAERHELFVEGDSVRPGILVLINDADWELEGEGDYQLQAGDRVIFISTLHGG